MIDATIPISFVLSSCILLWLFASNASYYIPESAFALREANMTNTNGNIKNLTIDTNGLNNNRTIARKTTRV